MARRPGLQAPARILWLVTGDGPSAGVRAMSWLDEVDTGTPERLHSRHARRGQLPPPSASPMSGTNDASASWQLCSSPKRGSLALASVSVVIGVWSASWCNPSMHDSSGTCSGNDMSSADLFSAVAESVVQSRVANLERPPERTGLSIHRKDCCRSV